MCASVCVLTVCVCLQCVRACVLTVCLWCVCARRVCVCVCVPTYILCAGKDNSGYIHNILERKKEGGISFLLSFSLNNIYVCMYIPLCVRASVCACVCGCMWVFMLSLSDALIKFF